MRTARVAPLAAFLALGVFWGVWGAVLPSVSARVAGGDDAGLGGALLCVAAGALPAMLLAGRLANRLGPRALAPAVAVFGLAAVLPAPAATLPALAPALLLLGAASGTLDVVMNAAASAIEAATGVRLMHLAHAAFSAGVFVCAVAAGMARDAGVGHEAVLGATALLILLLAFTVRQTLPPRGVEPARPIPPASAGSGPLLGAVSSALGLRAALGLIAAVAVLFGLLAAAFVVTPRPPSAVQR